MGSGHGQFSKCWARRDLPPRPLSYLLRYVISPASGWALYQLALGGEFLSDAPWKGGFPPSGSQAMLAVPPPGFVAKSYSYSQKVLTGTPGLCLHAHCPAPGLHICKASPLPTSETCAHKTLATHLQRAPFSLCCKEPPSFCPLSSVQVSHFVSPGPTEASAPSHSPA